MVRLVSAVTKTGKSCLPNRKVRYKNKVIGTDSLTSIIEYMHIVPLLHYSLS